MSNDELSNVLEGYKYKSYVPIVSFAGGKEDLATQRRDMVISSIGELIYNSLDLSPVAVLLTAKRSSTDGWASNSFVSLRSKNCLLPPVDFSAGRAYPSAAP